MILVREMSGKPSERTNDEDGEEEGRRGEVGWRKGGGGIAR